MARNYQPYQVIGSNVFVHCAGCKTLINPTFADKAKVKVGFFRGSRVFEVFSIDLLNPGQGATHSMEVPTKVPIYKNLFVCTGCLQGRKAIMRPPKQPSPRQRFIPALEQATYQAPTPPTGLSWNDAGEVTINPRILTAEEDQPTSINPPHLLSKGDRFKKWNEWD